MIKCHSKDKKARTRQQGRDSMGKTARTRQQGQDNKDKTTRTKQNTKDKGGFGEIISLSQHEHLLSFV
jgi:hypothetical protein